MLINTDMLNNKYDNIYILQKSNLMILLIILYIYIYIVCHFEECL